LRPAGPTTIQIGLRSPLQAVPGVEAADPIATLAVRAADARPAVMGDGTDDIPGIDGIGSVTAAKLLTEYGTLQQVPRQATSAEGIKGQGR
jgi:5'-3' exonuclease